MDKSSKLFNNKEEEEARHKLEDEGRYEQETKRQGETFESFEFKDSARADIIDPNGLYDKELQNVNLSEVLMGDRGRKQNQTGILKRMVMELPI